MGPRISVPLWVRPRATIAASHAQCRGQRQGNRAMADPGYLHGDADGCPVTLVVRAGRTRDRTTHVPLEAPANLASIEHSTHCSGRGRPGMLDGQATSEAGIASEDLGPGRENGASPEPELRSTEHSRSVFGFM